MAKVRSVKVPGEVDRLEAAAHLAEDGIARAIDEAGPGVTERDLASIVASVMSAGGGIPRFVVVTSGERSALSDARAADRALQPGDLVRFDVGCTVDGYWSDIGRTAVVGGPDPLQARRYAAILAGEDAQLDTLRAGVTAGSLFDVAVAAVEAGGLLPYRRHHCGHGIGTAVYEPPSVAPAGAAEALEAGMVLCLETPYYEIGWGGMMVEDTVVVTAGGHRRLTRTDRSLRVIPA
jgi:Xaa-Pro aminopeptidase